MKASYRGQGTRVPVGGERPEEELAFAVVRRVLGVPVERHDRDGRQGAVDALVRYPRRPLGRAGGLFYRAAGRSQDMELPGQAGVLQGSPGAGPYVGAAPAQGLPPG